MQLDLPPTLALRVTFRTAEEQRLPPFLGSALHGALGRALWRTVCAFPRRAECPGCPLYGCCAYPALFETPAPAREALVAAGVRDQAPRPLVLGPEPGWTRGSGNAFALGRDAEVPVRLTLIGRAIDDLPIVVVALRRLAQQGLGIRPDGGASRERPRLTLASVSTAEAGETIYDGSSEAYTPPSFPHPSRESVAFGHVAIELVTPLRLKRNGRILSSVTPPDFFHALSRRANALALLYGPRESAINEQDVTALASGLQVGEGALRLVHVRRYSARQRQRMEWPGVMGYLRWSGPALGTLWPLLRFGELVQVGKGTTMGFGRYRLAPDS